jgi:hypothetical protein
MVLPAFMAFFAQVPEFPSVEDLPKALLDNFDGSC